MVKKLLKYWLLLTFFFHCSDPENVEEYKIFPEIRIIGPEPGSVISELTLLSAIVTDSVGVEKVDFIINDSLLFAGKNSDSLYNYEWNTSKYIDGQYKVSVIAKNTIGNTKKSSVFILQIDNSRSAPNAQNIINIKYDSAEMTIYWEPSMEKDFLRYEILSSFSYNGSRDLMASISDSSVNSFKTSNFNPAITMFYWLKVVDKFNYQSTGNGYRLLDAVPTPVILDAIELESGKYKFNWTTNNDSDFVSYTLKLIQEIGTIQDSTIYHTKNRYVTNFTANTIPKNKNYQITVEDYWGLYSKSNLLEIDYGPPPVILDIFHPDTLKIQNENLDTTIFIGAQVYDDDGIETIYNTSALMYLESNQLTPQDTIVINLFDDGSFDTLSSGGISGDAVLGDGLYSNKIKIKSSKPKGTYSLIFYARDRNNQLSTPKSVFMIIK